MKFKFKVYTHARVHTQFDRQEKKYKAFVRYQFHAKYINSNRHEMSCINYGNSSYNFIYFTCDCRLIVLIFFSDISTKLITARIVFYVEF